ncbi:MAG: alpha/beta hydrolase-fold protein [archaeon]|nr:alpha/beta hydrolase-fold protein [archaeon]MDA1168240.1 alpha/beta hydrolase-fold protein [archaeon]
MPAHSFEPIQGQIVRFSFDSKQLQNKLGDPTTREVMVHVSPEAVQLIQQGHRLPVLVYLAPFTSSAPARAGWKAFSESILQRHERLVKKGKMKPVYLVLPDTFTSLGGNQFIDSPILGHWSTWLSNDLQEEMAKRFNTNGRFSILGKSSGGYGAMMNAMLFGDRWHGVASHSGDVGFDFMFKHDFFNTLRRLEAFSSMSEFVNSTRVSDSISHDTLHDLMMIALAASYCPPKSNDLNDIQFPITGAYHTFDEQIWQDWKRWDPLEMVKTHGHHLSKLSVFFLDCGRFDQYNIHFGSRLLSQTLNELGIEHTYEEFDGTHSSIDYRLDVSLALLSQI